MRTSSPEQLERYRAEPYAVASDIYAPPSYAGRAGWTWYTGSAGLFFRTVTESILGLYLEGSTLRIDPCLPSDWDEAAVFFAHPDGSRYAITIHNPHHISRGVVKATLNKRPLLDNRIPLQADTKLHIVDITLGSRHDQKQ